jgi:hypothetical protein
MSDRATSRKVKEVFAKCVKHLPPPTEGMQWAIEERSSVYGKYRWQIGECQDKCGAIYQPFGSRYYTGEQIISILWFLSDVRHLDSERSS